MSNAMNTQNIPYTHIQMYHMYHTFIMILYICVLLPIVGYCRLCINDMRREFNFQLQRDSLEQLCALVHSRMGTAICRGNNNVKRPNNIVRLCYVLVNNTNIYLFRFIIVWSISLRSEGLSIGAPRTLIPSVFCLQPWAHYNTVLRNLKKGGLRLAIVKNWG